LVNEKTIRGQTHAVIKYAVSELLSLEFSELWKCVVFLTLMVISYEDKPCLGITSLIYSEWCFALMEEHLNPKREAMIIITVR
jgi:hypothetical protein